MRAVVVGASSGLGRCIATGLGQRGATVALMARRADRLADAAAEAGNGSVGIALDVTDEASCASAMASAVHALGGIDAVVYCPAVGPLQRIADVDVATWRHVFDTNVVGAALVTTAALPHLTETSGVAVYLSSISASVTAPWPGLGAYAVSKAALDKLVEAFRSEHPTVGFTRVIVGDTAGGDGFGATEFANGWDLDLMMELHGQWSTRDLLAGALMDVAELVKVVDTVVRCGASATIPTVSVVPRRPA